MINKALTSKWNTFSISADNHLNVIIGNMCRYVRVNYWDINFESKGWFKNYTWNKEEEAHFKKWLSDYIYGVRDAQREFYGRTDMKKKECIHAADWFILQYGWSLSKDDE